MDNYQQLDEHIKHNDFRNIYLLTGPEDYLRLQYLKRLTAALTGGDTMNYHYYEGAISSVDEILSLADTMPFLASRRVIVLENSGLFKASKKDKEEADEGGGSLSGTLADYLAGLPESTFFVFSEAEADKRGRLYKLIAKQGTVVIFDRIDDKTLARWVTSRLSREGKRIGMRTYEELIDRVGTDMTNLEHELEKLICYCHDDEEITPEAVLAVCSRQLQDRLFDMINDINIGKKKAAIECYYDLVRKKEAPMKIIRLLATNYNQLLEVKSYMNKGYDQKAIAAAAKLHPYKVSKLMSQSRSLSTDRLIKHLEACTEAEAAIKTGRLNDRLSAELLIMSLF